MKKIALCLAVLLSAVTVSTSSWADGNELPAPPAPAPSTACAQPSCEHVVTKKGRLLGYRYARVPVYAKRRVVVHDNCCAPPPAEAKIAPPAPKTVTVEQKVFVRVVPKIVYVPARLSVQPQVCCPPGANLNLPPCRPEVLGSTGYGPERAAVARPQWTPTVDCAAMGGVRTTNPNTGKPSCFVPNRIAQRQY